MGDMWIYIAVKETCKIHWGWEIHGYVGDTGDVQPSYLIGHSHGTTRMSVRVH